MKIMTNRLKSAFSEIHAEAELKEQTKHFITLHNTANNRMSRQPKHSRLISFALVIVMILVIGGGITAYFTPVAAISIDADASIELQLNRFDRVVNFEQYGQEVNVPLTHMMHSNYTEAVKSILNNEELSSFGNVNSPVEITVVSKYEAKSSQMMVGIQTASNNQEQPIKVFIASLEEQKAAHKHGMSMGKHRMFKMLIKEEPSIQAEEILNYSMEDLHEMMESDFPNSMHNPKKHPSSPMNHH